MKYYTYTDHNIQYMTQYTKVLTKLFSQTFSFFPKNDFITDYDSSILDKVAPSSVRNIKVENICQCQKNIGNLFLQTLD